MPRAPPSISVTLSGAASGNREPRSRTGLARRRIGYELFCLTLGFPLGGSKDGMRAAGLAAVATPAAVEPLHSPQRAQRPFAACIAIPFVLSDF